MIIPRSEQIEGANEAFDILKEYGLVYLAWEERTGKSLTSILICEKCQTVKKVLIVTKKKALDGWKETLSNYKHNKIYTLINYQSIHKVTGNYDLVILDEAHANISGYPKRSTIWKNLWKFCTGKPIIYCSATPRAQGNHLLFNQLALSSWSPWAQYKDYYKWYEYYAERDAHGKYQVTYIGHMNTAINYTKIKSDDIWNSCKHLFTTRTRKELGFEQEPEDQLHYIKLDEQTTNIYNQIAKHKVLSFTHAETNIDYTLVCDSGIKLRWALHMIEGGTLKIGDTYLSIGNTEKIDYIFKNWGDTKDVVIMYQYIQEGEKLRNTFKNATILQATAYAEGTDLSMYKHLIIMSQDFSTAKHTQRRARQANKERMDEIKVHFLLVRNAISDKLYKTVSMNKRNFVDTVFEEI